jgi:hypothetical protein
MLGLAGNVLSFVDTIPKPDENLNSVIEGSALKLAKALFILRRDGRIGELHLKQIIERCRPLAYLPCLRSAAFSFVTMQRRWIKLNHHARSQPSAFPRRSCDPVNRFADCL